jgi:hypothetical protein
VPEGIPVSGRAAAGDPAIETPESGDSRRPRSHRDGLLGRGAVRSVVLGSVSHSVLNHTTVPVLIIHDGSRESSEAPPPRRATAR